ncbi:MAG: CPBP family intramembrane glutamic endopeptidase [Candidatus Sulfotelmatobacter sp.]
MSSPESPQFDPQPLNRDPEPRVPPTADTFAPVEPPPTPDPKAGENPVWSGWDVLQIAGLTLLTLFLTQFLIVLGARHFVFPHESWLEVAQKPSLALLSELLTYVAVALYMILLVEGKYRARFGQAIRWNWPGIAGASFIGVGVLMLGLDLLGRFLPMPKSTPFDQFFAQPSDAYMTAALAVTLGPLMEELFFRGFLYPVIARRLGIVWGILLTALPFGLIHMVQYGYAWGAVLIIFLVGVVLTTVRALTKSVGASFLAHVGYNAALMVLSALATDGFRHMDKAGIFLFCR